MAIGDLISDIEHDLRGRMRDLVKETEDLIDNLDPAKAWDEFEAEMYRKTSTAVVQNFTLLRQNANDLAARVSQHFEADHSEIVSHLEIVEPVIVSADGTDKVTLKLDRSSARSQAVSALRATAGGMTTISILSGVAQIALAAPFLAVVGVAFGRKLMKDEQARQLAMRRAQAKQAVRRYSDDVLFASGKESRDALRRIHRQLRDHFLARADELSTSTNESLAAAKLAVQSSEQARRTARRSHCASRTTRTGDDDARDRGRLRVPAGQDPLLRQVVLLVADAASAYRGTEHQALLDDVMARLHEPLRVAVGGKDQGR